MAEFFEGSDLKLMIEIRGMGFDQATDDYTIDIYNDNDKAHYTQDDVVEDGNGGYFLPVSHETLHAGTLVMVVTGVVPDEDYPGGYRLEVARPVKIGMIMKIPR